MLDRREACAHAADLFGGPLDVRLARAPPFEDRAHEQEALQLQLEIFDGAHAASSNTSSTTTSAVARGLPSISSPATSAPAIAKPARTQNVIAKPCVSA